MNIVNYIKVFNRYPILYNKCRVSAVKFNFFTTATAVCKEIIFFQFLIVYISMICNNVFFV